jgi:hypothetical protein
MSRDAFAFWAEDLGEEISDTGLPVGLERGVHELRAARDEIRNLLRNSKVQKELFPEVGEDDPTRADLKRMRLAWRLSQEIYNEYEARVVALANYSKRLAAAGITKNALVREGEEAATWKALTPEERRRVRESLQDIDAKVQEAADV